MSRIKVNSAICHSDILFILYILVFQLTFLASSKLLKVLESFQYANYVTSRYSGIKVRSHVVL